MLQDKMKPKYALEDYIYEMEARSLEAASAADDEEQDVYTQLQQKEKDLILAAELGKALLEKNEELSKQNERIAEEYSQNLERLEQDRHELRRQLAAARSEAESRLLELQADLQAATRQLAEREAELRRTDREKAALVAELTEQNLRLAARLKESARTEEQLTSQLQGLRDQCNLKKSSLQDHVSSLEVLRDEVQLLSEKKSDLERRIRTLLEERDAIRAALEDATDRVVLLEHQVRDQEMQLRNAQRELDHLRTANGSLGERLEALASTAAASSNNSSGVAGHRSLLAEMECENEANGEASPLLGTLTPDAVKIKEEAFSVYLQLRRLCAEWDRKRNDSITSDPESLPMDSIPVDILKPGMLSGAMSELMTLLCEPGGRRESSCSSGTGSVLEMEVELHRTRESLEKTERQLQERTEELRKRTDEALQLKSKLSVREAELLAAKEERDQARLDLQNTHLARDEIINKAWQVRDGAVARKNATEVELARTRIDVMQVNSQLLEAIQQKVELSQQLEQWQMDMQALLDEQMKHKLTNQANTSDYESSSSSSASSSSKKRAPSRRLFGLFQR
ncbi:bicaudal D-related protein homolog [Schistocerca americana]|uniref:bicaudal D-related protein homolog n=1 Tax=Schistocerca americana TaxID=7009 RepID=UPI001F4F456F|nr:bicaudal D-related protein homolog [Schistocerca americana]